MKQTAGTIRVDDTTTVSEGCDGLVDVDYTKSDQTCLQDLVDVGRRIRQKSL